MRRAGLLLLAGVAACGFLKSRLELDSPQGEALYQGWKSMREDLTPENEYWVGRSVATNVLARHGYRYLDAEALRAGRLEGVTAYVNQVGQVIAYAALDTRRGGDRPAPIAGFHFVVLESDVVNGFAAPGGFVFITTAALRLAQSEDELAALLAHEVAHVVRGHALGTIKKSRYSSLSKDLFKSTVKLDGPGLEKLNQALEGSLDDMLDAYFVKGYGRDTELEADRVGLAILAHAGYDPNAFVTLLGRLEAQQATGKGGFYATHPRAEDRIAKLTARLGATKGGAPSKARDERYAQAVKALRAPAVYKASDLD